MALQHVRSNTANKRPVATNLADGQLAVNYHADSPGLYAKDSNNTLFKVGPIHVGTTAPNATPAGSSGNSRGEGWLDTSGTNPVLKVWNGTAWATVQPIASGTVVSTADTGTVTSTMIADGTITNTDINASAAIALSKLATGALPTAITVASANLVDGTIADADINASAAIAHSKLASLTAGNVLLGNASNVPTSTAVTGDVTISSSGVTAIAAGAVVNADISNSAAIAHSKLANITAGQVLLGNASNVPTATALSGDVTVSSTGVTAIKSSVALTGTPTAPTAGAGTNTTQIATTEFVTSAVDAAKQGLTYKAACRVATTANITLSGTQTIDGIAVAAGERVLVKNQSTASQNGIYVVAAGAWTRATDFDATADLADGAFVFVEEGTANADTGWVLSTDGAITVGTTALTFVQFSGAGTYSAGNGLQLSGTQFSLAALPSANLLIGNGSNVATATAVTGDVTISNTGVTAIGASKVTNTMLAGSIADSKLSTISTAGKVANSATTATNLNTASAIVARDASGNFSAGTITAALSGNASTATKLATARAINGVNFDGSADITISAAISNAVTFNNGGTGGASGSAFDGTSALTVSYNTVGAPSTTGTGASGSWGISVTGSSASCTGNAATATALQTARTINGVSFDGSANITLTANTPNTVTFNNGGAGAASGSTFNGGSPITVSYNTIGALGATQKAADSELIDGIDSSRIVYGGNGAAVTSLNATQNVYELGQYKSGFWEVSSATWTPNTDWWWGATFAHSSNGPSYNFCGQLAFQNGNGADGIYARTISNGTAGSWGRLLSSGNFNTYAPTLTGTGASGTWGISVTGSSASCTGNAATATTLATGRTIGMTGDVTWTSASFNGSANVTGTATLANSGVTAGTYNDSATAVRPFTVDAKGRVTGIGTAVTITPAWSSIASKPTTLSGFGITDAAPLASPALTGTPTAPTAALNTNTTQIATTAYVLAAIADGAPTKTGGNASGTWGISITGSSASTTGSSASCTGNSATATKLSTTRTFALTGDITGTVDSDLTSGASIATAIAAGAIVNADINASAAIADTKLDTISTAGKVSNSATTATSANTANAIVARDANGDINVTSINSGPLAGCKNRIINGAMTIQQRTGPFTQVADNTYTLDRFAWSKVGAMQVTIAVSTDVPNTDFTNSMHVDVTTADTSLAAGEYAFIAYKAEGYDVHDLRGKTFTLSFWVKSAKTGTHCVAFRNSGTDRSYVATYTVAVANTWEFKTITITNGLITAGTWNWTSGVGLNIAFVLANGSSFQTTAGAWQTGNFLSTSTQVNVMDNIANNFYITGVQLELGPVATPFERRPIAAELELCNRYFQLVDYSDGGFTSGSVTISGSGYYACPMRIAPIASIYGYGAIGGAPATSAGITISTGAYRYTQTFTATSAYYVNFGVYLSAEF